MEKRGWCRFLFLFIVIFVLFFLPSAYASCKNPIAIVEDEHNLGAGLRLKNALVNAQSELLDADKISLTVKLKDEFGKKIASQLNGWLRTENGKVFLATKEGKEWLKANRKPFYRRWFSSQKIDAEKISRNANELPEDFLKQIGINVKISNMDAGEAKNMDILAFDLNSLDYDSLLVINILGLPPDIAVARLSELHKIGKVYKEEVGFLDAGRPTPQLLRLVDEGVLAQDELEKLRRGAPMAMGGPDIQVQMRAVWQVRDNEISAGVKSLIDGRVSELSFSFSDTDKFPAHNVKLTKERWSEFLDKHIYGSSGLKTQLPPEFRNNEAQKELLEKIIKLAVREKGASGKTLRRRPDLDYIIKNISVKGYIIQFVIGKKPVSQQILDLHPISINKKMQGG